MFLNFGRFSYLLHGFWSSFLIFWCLLQQIGTALLPITVNNKALPAPAEAAPTETAPTEAASAEAAPTEVAPAEATPEAAVVENSIQKAEAVPEPQAEVPAEPAPEINSTPQNEVKAVSHPRPLSPYAAVNIYNSFPLLFFFPYSLR